MKSSSRIGIFGGSFDPPHVGHLIIAEEARERLNLQKVFFVPAFIPPHKPNAARSNPEHRLQMTKLAIAGNDALEVSDIELRRKGISYTVDTLREFKQRFSKAELFLIVGADNLLDLDSWKSPDEIRELASLAVYRRRGFDDSQKLKAMEKDIYFLQGTPLDFSSSEIRRRVANGKSLRYLVPEKVEQYILTHGLYRQ